MKIVVGFESSNRIALMHVREVRRDGDVIVWISGTLGAEHHLIFVRPCGCSYDFGYRLLVAAGAGPHTAVRRVSTDFEKERDAARAEHEETKRATATAEVARKKEVRRLIAKHLWAAREWYRNAWSFGINYYESNLTGGDCVGLQEEFKEANGHELLKFASDRLAKCWRGHYQRRVNKEVQETAERHGVDPVDLAAVWELHGAAEPFSPTLAPEDKWIKTGPEPHNFRVLRKAVA